MYPRNRFASTLTRLWCWLLLAAMIVTMPGCSGCGQKPKTPEEIAAEEAKKKAEEAKKKKEEEEKKKKDFELGPAVALPHNPVSKDRDRRRQGGEEQERGFCYVKPGHWTSTAFYAKANKEDFQGQLQQQAMTKRGEPLHLEAVPFDIVTTRGVAMPKGQEKAFESPVFVPPTGQVGWVEFRVRAAGGGRTVGATQPILRIMPSYQYHFVVLADVPERYSYLSKLDSVAPPTGDTMTDRRDTRSHHYLIDMAPVRAGQPPPLPSHALFWTSTAYVLWDGADPTALSLDQQTALIDWLHWGGQLIVSGPQTLESLSGSFLKDYLPATVPTGGPASRELTADDLAEISRNFTLPEQGLPADRLTPKRPWEATLVKLHRDARYVPGTGELLIERRVGRGRIVASVFRLSGKELAAWTGFDNFFNACVLGRPPRQYMRVPDGGMQLQWADRSLERLDAGLVCGLRYFSRDTGMTMIGSREVGTNERLGAYGDDVVYERLNPYDLSVDQKPPGTGVAAWNDFNAAAQAARQSLSKSSRIEVPQRSFVVWSVLLYVAVLVPINWVLFWALGRVEWAWVAAPVIAICSTVLVIHLAQLDIGFARSVTEIGVLEIQGDYPRAHLTRYMALYTSLSTSYEMDMEGGGQLQPFPRVSSPEQFHLQPGESYEELAYEHTDDVHVSGFQVASNSTQYLHSEQMIDLDGPLALQSVKGSQDNFELVNRTAWTLHGVGLVRRLPGGRVEAAWAGEVEPGRAAAARFEPQSEASKAADLWSDQREESPLTASVAAPGYVTLRDLVELAQDPAALAPGEVRLIGYLVGEPAMIQIDPAAPQSQRATLVVAHLRYGFGPDPKSDLNSAPHALEMSLHD